MPELLITHENHREHTGAGQLSFPFDGHDRALNALPPRVAYGQVEGVLTAEEVVDLIPRDEWQDRIKQKDEDGSWLENICGEIPPKDQNGLGYCHAYGTVSCVEIARLVQGYSLVDLSAESVGGPVTGWKNEGAYPEDDLRVVAKRGACLASFMDRPNSLKPSRWKDGWEENALEHRALEWFDLRIPGGKTFDAVMTCYLLNYPIGLGYQWWSHFVHGGYRARYSNGKYEIEERNSWGGTYGENGYFWLQEGTRSGQGTPDWAFAIRAVTPSES